MAEPREQRILTDNEIVDIVLKYIDEDIYNYAIMIDGEWGCGKTYFIKQSLMDEIERHEIQKAENIKEYEIRHTIYISLYGIKSTDEISRQIFTQSYLGKAGRGKELIQTGAKIAGAVLALLPTFGIDFDADSISNQIAELLPVKNAILIFDDIERCNCPINETLGYINSFVEQGGLKVILVANQKEIGHSTYQANRELKYLVAANPIIEFRDALANRQGSRMRCNGQKMIEEIRLDIDTIDMRVDRLFKTNKEFEYLKEKVIGKVIFYRPKLKEILLLLIQNDRTESELVNLLVGNVSFFDKYMSENTHFNIRTFQFFLSKIKDLYYAVSKFKSNASEDFMLHIIQYTFMVCVNFKAGTYECDWSENEEYRERRTESSDLWILSFRFVDDFVLRCVLDINKARKMLEIYEDYYYKSNNQEFRLFSNLEHNWHLYTDIEAEEIIQKIMRGLDENKYDPGIYANILNTLWELFNIGFEEEYVKLATLKMEHNILLMEEHAYLDRGSWQNGNRTTGAGYENIIYELQAKVDTRFKMKKAEAIGQFLLEENGWAENLYIYVQNNSRVLKEEIGFLSQLDEIKLREKLENSSSRDLYAFKSCISTLYEDDSIRKALSCDENRLIKLKRDIEQLNKDQFDKIQRMNMEYIVKSIESAIALYKSAQTVDSKTS